MKVSPPPPQKKNLPLSGTNKKQKQKIHPYHNTITSYPHNGNLMVRP